jgi:hypothetical protein
MAHNKYMPQYHCWSENDFQADRQVQRMPYPARRLYRALLQAAFTCPTRPYLPADDEELYLLAEADDLDYWNLHKGPVLKMFTSLKGEDGEELLERKRLTRDWLQMMETIAQKQKAGRARHGKSAYAEHNLAEIEQRIGDALKLKPETKIKTETKTKQNSNLNQSVSVSGSDTVSCSDESIRKFHLPDDSEILDDLLSTWIALSGKTGSAADFKPLLEGYIVHARDNTTTVADLSGHCKGLMRWALNTSDYWPSRLKSSRSFRDAYDTIEKQWRRYQAAASASAETEEEANDPDEVTDVASADCQ